MQNTFFKTKGLLIKTAPNLIIYYNYYITSIVFFKTAFIYAGLAALTDLEVCFVDSNVLKGFVLSDPKFAEGYLKHISIKALKTHDQLFNLTQKKMHGRLAEGLLYISNELFKSDQFKCIMTRQEIGEFTNMNKESVVRILNKFNSENIIKIDHSNIEILDKKRLEQISYSG